MFCDLGFTYKHVAQVRYSQKMYLNQAVMSDLTINVPYLICKAFARYLLGTNMALYFFNFYLVHTSSVTPRSKIQSIP